VVPLIFRKKKNPVMISMHLLLAACHCKIVKLRHLASYPCMGINGINYWKNKNQKKKDIVED